MPRNPRRPRFPAVKPGPKPADRRAPAGRDRADAILLDRGTCTAREAADRHGVSVWTVYSVWRGRRWHGTPERVATLVLVARRPGAWEPATGRDVELLGRILGSSARWDAGLAVLVGLAAERGIAVLFRGDLSPAPAAAVPGRRAARQRR